MNINQEHFWLNFPFNTVFIQIDLADFLFIVIVILK